MTNLTHIKCDRCGVLRFILSLCDRACGRGAGVDYFQSLTKGMGMRIFQPRLLIVGLIMLAGGEFTCAGDYSDPSGFSLTVPDGWVVVNRGASMQPDQALPPEFKDWMAKNNFDLNQVKVELVRQEAKVPLESVNVAVDQRQISINDRAVENLKDTLVKGYAEIGMTLKNLQSKIGKIGARDAIIMEYQTQMRGIPDLLRQKQVVIPGGGKTFTITCSAPDDSFDQHRPAFDQVLASFQAPPPLTAGFDWGSNPGLVGGIVGGLAVLIWKMLKGKRR
jgi:hypothetical protein